MKPFNRHILLKPDVLDSAEESTVSILVPEEFKPKPTYMFAEVLAMAEDCKAVSSLKVGDTILYNNSMVEEVEVKGEIYYLLLENYVLCLVS